MPFGDVMVHSIPGENLLDVSSYWEELPCGIYSIHFGVHNDQCVNQGMVGTVTKHEWTDILIKSLIAWTRSNVEPKNDDLCHQCCTIQRRCTISSLMLNETPSLNVTCINDPILTQLNCHHNGNELHGNSNCSNKIASDISCTNQPKTVSLLNGNASFPVFWFSLLYLGGKYHKCLFCFSYFSCICSFIVSKTFA